MAFPRKDFPGISKKLLIWVVLSAAPVRGCQSGSLAHMFDLEPVSCRLPFDATLPFYSGLGSALSG